MNTRTLALAMAAILAVGTFNASTSGNVPLAIALALGALTALVGPAKVVGGIVGIISGTLGIVAFIVAGLIALLIVLAFAQAMPTAAAFLLPTLGILATIAAVKGLRNRVGNAA